MHFNFRKQAIERKNKYLGQVNLLKTLAWIQSTFVLNIDLQLKAIFKSVKLLFKKMSDTRIDWLPAIVVLESIHSLLKSERWC